MTGQQQRHLAILLLTGLLILTGNNTALWAQTATARQRLFSADVRRMQPSPVYDFLEQALADHQSGRPDRQLQLNKVTFARGGWVTLATIHPTDACQISTLGNDLGSKRYVVSWTREGRELLCMSFPIDFELLLGAPRCRLEHQFITRLKAQKPAATTTPRVNANKLQPHQGDGIGRLPGKHLKLMPQLTSDTYYTTNGEPTLVSDRQHPAETLANWLLTGSARPRGRLAMKLSMTDNSQQQLDVSLAQWYAFCKKEGCTSYYIYEKQTGGKHTAMVVVANTSTGYAHMLYVTCPDNQLCSQQPQLAARVYLYLPISNVADVFAKSPGKTEKKWKYE